LEYILISPAQHQLHHSVDVKHHDKNFGAALAIWDYVFGSLHHSVEIDDLKLGIDNQERDFNRLSTLYFSPIIEIKNILKNKMQSLILMIKVAKR
jgi:sterol desaturase/sphingolipid hydroxylase (fatty acid hydroxylase superfamily)